MAVRKLHRDTVTTAQLPKVCKQNLLAIYVWLKKYGVQMPVERKQRMYKLKPELEDLVQGTERDVRSGLPTHLGSEAVLGCALAWVCWKKVLIDSLILLSLSNWQRYWTSPDLLLCSFTLVVAQCRETATRRARYKLARLALANLDKRRPSKVIPTQNSPGCVFEKHELWQCLVKYRCVGKWNR